MPKKPPAPRIDPQVTIDADPAAFDIEDWLSGATLPARAVKIYRDAGLRAEFDDLEQQFRSLQAHITEDDPGEETLAEQPVQGRLIDIAARMKSVMAQLEASALTVRVRAATRDEVLQIRESLGKESTEDSIQSAVLALTATPSMTAEQWQRFRNKVGDKQYLLIVAASNDANGFSGDGVVPDFSPAASALLSTKRR